MNAYGFMRLFWRPMALAIPLFALLVAGQLEIMRLLLSMASQGAPPLIEIPDLGSESIGMCWSPCCRDWPVCGFPA